MNSKLTFLLLSLPVLLGLAACQTSAPKPASPTPVTIKESWFSQRNEADNIDSPAVWHGPNGEHWCFATAKKTDVVVILDAINGNELRRLGSSGTAAGQLERPNGVWVVDDLLFVVERDNKRVQVFALPSLESLLIFGQPELVKPYGIYIHQPVPSTYQVYVTDNYELVEDQVPPDAELGRRVYRYQVTRQGAGLSAAKELQFGATSGPGVLRIVESINGDTKYDRLLIAEEEEDASLGGLQVKVYTLDGQYTGTNFGSGLFHSQVEGIALDARPDGSGYWIVTDQSHEANTFHFFDRKSLRHRGAFRAEITSNTDGIWLDTTPLPDFGYPRGIFYAVHNDGNVAGIDYATILRKLGLQ